MENGEGEKGEGWQASEVYEAVSLAKTCQREQFLGPK